jgi:hypothetical protein
MVRGGYLREDRIREGMPDRGANEKLGGTAFICYTAVPKFIPNQEPTLDIHRIIAELKAERDRIDQAIAAIGNIGTRGERRGRPPGTSSTKRRKHKLSPEGRRRISEMMKKRWAEYRKRAA